MATPNAQTNLGSVLKDWRYLNKIDLRTAGAQIGISHVTLQRIEHGGMFDVETWLKIQNWLFATIKVEAAPMTEAESIVHALKLRKEMDPEAPDAVVLGRLQ